ncbi:MAG: NUMOD4 motif-containing HNH endonuclease [Anaerolineae bacterium]|nr:NUMOD4 motif-containing HNH endonuclease [Anaerolineae bacterium]
MNKQDENGIEWRDVPGYEELYQVSSDGQVKRLAGERCHKERLLKPAQYRNGYTFVTLSKAGKTRSIQIHQLVCWAFVGEQGDFWVNHKNGIKDDNRLENLEYVTPGGNNRHAYDTGLRHRPLGSKNPRSKLTEDDVWMIRMAIAHCYEELGGIAGIAKVMEVSKTTIVEIKNGNSWSHLEVYP